MITAFRRCALRSGLHRVWVVCALAMGAASARAHDPGLSTSELRLMPHALSARLHLHDRDLERLQQETGEELEEVFGAALTLWVGGVRTEPLSVANQSTERGSTELVALFPLQCIEGSDPGAAEVEISIGEHLPFGHKHFLRISDSEGTPRVQRLIGKPERVALPLLDPALSPASSPAPRFAGSVGLSFLCLGIEHILLGFDHLLFLGALLVVSLSLRSVLGVVSLFTLAHSLTLIAGALGLLLVPAWLVEPTIAASIVCVAALNLSGRHGKKGRAWLTFGCGLIHGLGFSSALSEPLRTHAADRVLALFSFNVGVELGQMAVVVVVVPLLSLAHSRDPSRRRVVTWGSAAAGALGMVWWVQRMIGP